MKEVKERKKVLKKAVALLHLEVDGDTAQDIAQKTDDLIEAYESQKPNN